MGSYPGAKTPSVDTALLSWEFCSQFSSTLAPFLPDPVPTIPADVFASADEQEDSNGGEPSATGDEATDRSGDTASGNVYLPHMFLTNGVGMVVSAIMAILV